MREVLVVSDEHTQLVIIHSDVWLNHLLWNPATGIYIIRQKIKNHDRVVHGWLSIFFLGKAIVIIPRFHHTNQFIYCMIERQDSCIILQHLPHFFLRETSQIIEAWTQRIVCSYVESTCQIIHCHRTNTRHEYPSERTTSSPFDSIEELSQIPLSMRLLAITHQMLLVGKNHVSEIVVLVDEEINLQTCFCTLIA